MFSHLCCKLARRVFDAGRSRTTSKASKNRVLFSIISSNVQFRKWAWISRLVHGNVPLQSTNPRIHETALQQMPLPEGPGCSRERKRSAASVKADPPIPSSRCTSGSSSLRRATPAKRPSASLFSKSILHDSEGSAEAAGTAGGNPEESCSSAITMEN